MKGRQAVSTILLVEDDENLRETVHDWLCFEKYRVETAADGLEAMEQLSVNSFDLIVLDWHLPHLDGIDVLKRYRESGGATPVLLLTGMTDASQRDKGISAGANSYVKKPFQLAELSKEIKKLLGKSGG
ncbi:MAG TPA: response regulator [Candidatus Obscuribacter sp.]|nr:response regulator [Candidatus Obscuribacter sp.]HMY55036.1 response regulator [Candidatus Obscuribacter sp.]HND07218.1 response regulator [Candidatus Obscuribacter sp.]HND69910.1 response regulator [Candidatus Obscuribacter sp.]HNG19903.1 response regulator [Candidatus Obscuribacter sp.]